jgi:predicted ribosome quality control (RQC) complex YloA/Tae2 family protein
MIKNYFFISRYILEAEERLTGYKYSESFTQERDKIIIVFIKEGEEKFLEISLNPGFPYMNLREGFKRAKKNSLSLFELLSPSPLKGFSIAEDDRIVRIEFESFVIYFAIRGKYTNIYSVKGEEESEFKKTEVEAGKMFYEEVKEKTFIKNGFDKDFKKDIFGADELANQYKYVGKEIIKEIKARGSEDVIGSLYSILNEIESGRPVVFINSAEGEVYLGVNTLHIFESDEVIEGKDLIEAVSIYIYKKFTIERVISKEKLIKKHLERELGKLSVRLNGLKGQLEKGSREEEMNKIGNLLLINLYSIKQGEKAVELKDIYDNEDIIIVKLDEKLNPQQNAERYFDKGKSERIKLEKSQKLFDELRKEYDRLKAIDEKYKAAESSEVLDKIMKELKIKENKMDEQKDDIKDKFKQYLIDEKYYLYVGKDSKSNDLLTVKFAKQNDYWFHARSVPGSHVVLRVDNNKEVVPKNILKKAASIAAFHSKAKTAGMVPVSFCLKKYVIKKKGMETGKVALLKEESLIVKPEIPEGCRYLSND